MQEIILPTGQIALVSDEDKDLCELNWSDNGNYAQMDGIYLHVVIARRMGLDVSKTIDHIDRNKYNCQRSNLRPASRSQQEANKSVNVRSTSHFKGVDFHKSKRRWGWRARIFRDGVSKHLGYFDSAEEAARAYDHAAQRLFGEFAVLNFPGS